MYPYSLVACLAPDGRCSRVYVLIEIIGAWMMERERVRESERERESERRV